MAAFIIRELPKETDDGCTHAAVDPGTREIRAYGNLIMDVEPTVGSCSSALMFLVERVKTPAGAAN